MAVKVNVPTDCLVVAVVAGTARVPLIVALFVISSVELSEYFAIIVDD